MDDLRNRVALVTGASRGIGAGIAVALAQAGADVTVNYRQRSDAAASSLEALKAYGVGRKIFYVKGDVASVPYYERAVDLDPNFALAYSALAVSFSNLGQATRSSENAKKAYNLRDRVSEREKYRISSLPSYMNCVLA